jgi:hypothetical protein
LSLKQANLRDLRARDAVAAPADRNSSTSNSSSHRTKECCRMSMFAVFGAFDLMQDFVSLVDAGASLLFADKAGRVVQIADDTPFL